MDELSRSLKRQALTGDTEALRRYRVLSIKSGKIPHEILLILATLNYPPARQIFTETQIAHFRGNKGTVELLYSYDSFEATCITTKVISAMMPLVLEIDSLNHTLEVCIPEDLQQSDIFLRDIKLIEVLHDADRKIKQLADCEFLLDISKRASKAYSSSKEPWNRGWQYKDRLVNDFYDTYQRLEALDRHISNCAEFEVRRGGPFFHLNLAIRCMATTINPPIVGFRGEYDLKYSLHQMRTFLFGMNFGWQNNAFVEAIFNYYLI